MPIFQILATADILVRMQDHACQEQHALDERTATLALAMVPGIGPQLRDRLFDHFGSARSVLRAGYTDLVSVPGIGGQTAREILSAKWEMAQEELQFCGEHGIHVVLPGEPAFPDHLTHIDSPPQAIFCLGELLPQDALAIAIVGTRHATSYGKRVTRKLASALSRAGMTVVSGLARGIDAEAHRAALDSGGRSIAVLPGGLLHVYPSEHQELATHLSRQGCLISEFPSRWPVQRGAFPRRNRLITGLALGVVVVEAAARSGALVSARHAMEQGREVFAVPGPVDSRMSVGCHALLRDGATLVETVEDVFEALGPLAETAARATGETVRHPAELQLNPQETQVLGCIGMEPTDIDHVVVQSQLPVQRVLATISALEVRHMVRRVGGNKVIRR